jgi:colanic acid/amylovoran biosynthesis glycosyltransferase
MFTAAYPYDRMNAWKGQELAVFRERFDEIYVAPLNQNTRELSPDLPEGVKVLPPVYPIDAPARSAVARFVGLFQRRFPKHLGLAEKGPRVADIRRFWGAVADLEEILQSRAWEDHVAPLVADSVLYFFWGRGYAAVIPYLGPAEQARSLVRLHRWDLYPDVNDGYIPFQRRIVESAGQIAPISQDGVDLLARLYPRRASKMRCLRLGTELNGLSAASGDEVFRIVSCAYARPVKRLHLIVDALRFIDFPISWTHIGDGPELPRIRESCADLGPNVSVEFLGSVPPEYVPRVYAAQPFDLFINASASEGIPVSIMEAMAAGIPALATDVGGNAEIVDSDTGKVLPADVSARDLATAISRTRDMPRSDRDSLRANSRKRIEDDYDQAKNARAVAQALCDLANTEVMT